MKYDFDMVSNRRDTDSLKWDTTENGLSMCGAGMVFTAAPEVRSVVEGLAGQGMFGEQTIPEEWYQAYTGWWKERHGFLMEKDWFVFCSGVVPAISGIIRKLTTPAEQVLLLTPVYDSLFASIVDNGRQVLESPLKYDGERYRADFQDLERKLADPQTTLMILCNPHDPAGIIWDREMLAGVGELCVKYHVTVIADENGCDLTAPGRSYIPFASVSENCRKNSITCISPAKAFNLAGLQTASVVVPDERLRHKVVRGLNTDAVASPNTFSAAAAIAAYTRGASWLDALRDYLAENRQAAIAFMKKEIPQIKAYPSDAGYFLWLDCREMAGGAAEMARFICKNTGLCVSPGNRSGGNGRGFLQMNIACPHTLLQDGLNRLRDGAASYGESVISRC